MKEEVNKTLQILNEGGTIVYPTDTIWGVGCDATNSLAVENVFKLKNRPDSKSMIILLYSVNQLERYVEHVPDVAYDLFEFATKPTTIILDGAKNVSPLLKANDGSIAIRIPKDPFLESLLQRFKKPLVSTSANLSGMISPNNFLEIEDAILDNADYVVNWRKDDLEPAQPSSIIKISKGSEIKIIRE